MYLIERDGRKRAICRECRKLHTRRECPKRGRSLAAKIADERWAWIVAYRAQQEAQRVG